MARIFLLPCLGGIALLFGLTTSVLLFILAAAIIGPFGRSSALVLASAILQLLSCCGWSYSLWRQHRIDTEYKFHHDQYDIHDKAVTLYWIIGIVPSIVAAIVTGTALGWSEGRLPESHVSVVGLSAMSFLSIIFVMWGIYLAARLIHFVGTTLLPGSNKMPVRRRFSIDEVPRQMTEPRHSFVAAATNPFNPYQAAASTSRPSSPPSLIPSDGTSSFRSSFSTLPRPLSSRPSTSRKALVVRQPSYTRPSRPLSIDIPSSRGSEEGFDSWDTSAVSNHLKESLYQSKSPPGKVSNLEPIPGSRSPSPAKALSGPFVNPSPSASPPSSPLPQPPVSPHGSQPASPTDIPNFASVFPPASSSPPASPPPLPKLAMSFPLKPVNSNRSSPMTSPVLPIMLNHSISRTPSISGAISPLTRSRAPSEDHIHPLFRTTSPSPTPSPSLGTVVTAAPEAGQLINERTLKRMRSGSLPNSSSPLVRSESFPEMKERLGSVDESTSEPSMQESREEITRGHQRKRSASFETFVRDVLHVGVAE